MSNFKFPESDNSAQNSTNSNNKSSSSNSKEFQFSANNFKPSPTRELSSISYLRDKLMPYMYCLPNDFFDVPQTILIFTASVDDESCQIPTIANSLCRRINYGKEYNKIPMNNIVFQSQKQLKSFLQTFLDQMIKPRFRDAFERIENEFTKIIVLNHQLDDAIQYGTLLSVNAAQHIKRYADYQMMKGEHKVAYSLYHQLIDHFPSEKVFLTQKDPQSSLISSIFSFGSSSSSASNANSTPMSYSSGDTPKHLECYMSALFCAVSCDIIIGEINDQTVKNLYFLRDNSPTTQYRLVVTLIIFWVLPRVGRASPEVLIDFLSIFEIEIQGQNSQMTVSEVTTNQSRTIINSSSLSSLSSFSILSSFHQSFSLNNLANTIYRQLSSDDLGKGEKPAFKLTFAAVVEPFLQEQIIQFCPPKEMPFQYFLLAERFNQTHQKYNYVRCLWNSFVLLMNTSEKSARLQYHNCEFCLAFLIEKIINVLLREKNFLNQPRSDQEWFLSDYIGYLMRFDNIQRLPVFASLFSMWDSKSKSYKSGFIHASVVSFAARNPMLTGPKGYKGNWRQVSLKLFGYSKSSTAQFNSFYFSEKSDEKSAAQNDSSVCETISVDDIICVKLSITNAVADFPVGETWLRVVGAASSERIKVGNGRKHEVCYTVRPDKPFQSEKGSLVQVVGLNTLWVNNVNLFTKFEAPVSFRCDQKLPLVVVEEVSVAQECFAGEASILKLVLHNGAVPLSSLTLLIEADDELLRSNRQDALKKPTSQTLFTILRPKTRNVGGQFFFGPVSANEDVFVDILCTSTVCGSHSHWLFFSYEARKDEKVAESERLCRYTSYNYRVTVYEALSVAMFPSFSPDFGFEVALRRVDDRRRFQISITNNTKSEVKNVVVEFLQKKSGKSDVVEVIDDDDCLNGFELNLGGYLVCQDEVNVPKKCLFQPMDVSPDIDDFHSTFDKFIIVGFTKKRFLSIGLRKSVAFCFDFESLDKETYPYVCISVGEKKFFSDMSAILHYYDEEEAK